MTILLIVEPEDEERLVRGLEIGVNDYIRRPVDTNELIARTRTQVRRKRYADYLLHSVRETMEMAVTDELTGLHNRRYLLTHLESSFQQAQQRRTGLTFLICDIDFFKSINHTYGHDVGDEVLKEFAYRMHCSLRGQYLVCRYGGEEFVIVMPDTDPGSCLWSGGTGAQAHRVRAVHGAGRGEGDRCDCERRRGGGRRA